MAHPLFRLVELLFTAYAVPALLVPVVWLTGWLVRLARGGARNPPATVLGHLLTAYTVLAALWVGLWLAVRLGVPIEKGGQAAGALTWAAFALLNIVLAWLLVRFTGSYGEIPEGSPKDRLFVRFLTAIVAQPIMTACAFAVLYRIMGLVYHLNVPALQAVQEGI
jgi:hypothetical protein